MKYNPLHTFISPVTGQLSSISSLPSLDHGKIWEGDSNNNAVEIVSVITPNAATYILNTSNGSLPNSQALDDLPANSILKIDTIGVISDATPDVDYATIAGANGLVSDTEDAADDAFDFAAAAAVSAAAAAVSAVSAGNSATSAVNSAITANAVLPAVTAASSNAAASAAAADDARGDASGFASDAADSRNDAQLSETNATTSAINAATFATNAATSASDTGSKSSTYLNTVMTFIDDVTGSDTVLNSIAMSFKDDSIFPGTGAITLPSGTTAERPGSPSGGTLRGNTDTSLLEFFNGQIWISL